MRLIESSVEYLPQEEGLEGIYEQIEKCGRTCYKSEDKIVNAINIDIANLPNGITVKDIPNYKTNQQQCIEYLHNHKIKYQIINSAKDFVDRMIKSNHTAMLEHGTVYLFIPQETNYEAFERYIKNNYSHTFEILLLPKPKGLYVVTNYRVLVENNWLDDLQYLCNPTKFHEKRYTFKFTTDRGISHELVRHRKFSFAQESQRYCNYSKEKHGGEITFIAPSWFIKSHIPIDAIVAQSSNTNGAVFYERPYKTYYYKDSIDSDGFDWSKEDFFIHSCQIAEQCYFLMIEEGAAPQQARAILPNATKTEIIMTGFASDWRFLLDLRLFEKTGKVHPDMLDLMQKTQKVMQEAGIWDDIMKYSSKFK